MRANTSAANTAVQLVVRKGSIFGPLLLLILTIFLFIVYALPSEYGELAGRLGLQKADAKKGDIAEQVRVAKEAGKCLVAEKVTAADIVCQSRKVFDGKESPISKLWEGFGSNPWKFVTDVIRPYFKVYLEQLATDFGDITRNVVVTVLMLGLYSLIPGLAGLIYRRNFRFWFLLSFVVLLAVNGSGLFSSLAGHSQSMPGSGKILLFVISQILLLLLAFRLRRQSTSTSRIPPRVYNWGLTALLVLIGVACWQGWGPGTGAPNDGAGDRRAGLRDCREIYCPALADVKGGSFIMGSDDMRFPEPGAAPAHPVAVKDFYISMFEVTHDEWEACVADGGACTKIEVAEFGRGTRPVEVGFEDANKFAAWLSKKTGKSYRLPTEAEWEYAARAGTTTRYYFGDKDDALSRHAWFADADARKGGGLKIHPVGRKLPNRLGLYDIYGNVTEWVADCYTSSYRMLPIGGSPVEAPKDGSAWIVPDCTTHIVRGGSYRSFKTLDLSSAKRAEPHPGTVRIGGISTGPSSGFRLVRDAAGGAPALKPETKLTAIANPSAGEARRSWIWSFLGSGFTGWVFKWEFILVGLPLIYSLMRNSADWTSRKRKNIVICLDGTSNTPDQIDQGFAATTNVYKLFRMLKADGTGALQPGVLFDASLTKRYDEKQIAFYYAGVGNKYDSDAIAQIFGQAAGFGADDTVERAYLDLVRVFRENDRVFIFGFSRGSAISRLLARAIYDRGAPRSVWTIKLFGKHRTLWSSKVKQPVPITVLGCWDTVGSFGVAKTIGGFNLQQFNLGRDLSLPENVQQAYHMVALDERRQEFEPTLMDPDPNRPERIIEVWFPGDHANIGGGWATDRLSDVTLDFLLRRISSGYADAKEEAGKETWGLHLVAWKADKLEYWKRQDEDPHIVDPDALGQIQQSFSHVFNYRPRKVPPHAMIHDSVFDRMISSLPLYAPQSLFDLNDELDRRRDLIDSQVAKLTESKLLSDEDLGKIADYKSKLRLNRFSEYYRDKLAPSFSSEYVPIERVLALGPDGTPVNADTSAKPADGSAKPPEATPPPAQPVGSNAGGAQT